MAKTDIIIDGEGVGAKLNDVSIDDIVEIGFSIFGDRKPIKLTTIDATKWEQQLFSDLEKIENITITKKSNPVADAALYSKASETLVITYLTGKSSQKHVTFFVQLANISDSAVARSANDGVNVDLDFFVTNLDTLVEQGPEIDDGQS